MSMKLFIGAVGRMKKGSEKDLFDNYFDRCHKIGPQVALTPIQLGEIPEAKHTSKSERQRLEAEGLSKMALGDNRLIVLDEHGKNLSSVKFTGQLQDWRDNGTRQTSFLIGGPDGIDSSLRQRADLVISFGAMTWPHMIARILLVEQLYRSISLLSGHPYHRE